MPKSVEGHLVQLQKNARHPLSASILEAQNIDVTTVAHELGHGCYLVWHDGNNGNLMFKSGPRGTSLDWWQTTLVRSSRHVTYF